MVLVAAQQESIKRGLLLQLATEALQETQTELSFHALNSLLLVCLYCFLCVLPLSLYLCI